MILHVLTADMAGPHKLHIKFNDGTSKTVDLLPSLSRPVFEPLRDPTYFARVSIDPIAGTVVWPNGADFAPEALRALPAVKRSTGGERAA